MVLLYHGTSPLNLRDIGQNGLCTHKPGFAPGAIFATTNPDYARRYAQPIPNEAFQRSDTDEYLERRFRGRDADVPGALLRFDDADPALVNCKKNPQLPAFKDEVAFRCRSRCVRPKMEVCVLPRAYRLPLEQPERPLRERCDGRWRPLRSFARA